MANPSSSEIIKSKPIGEGLSPFRNSFNSICKGLGLSSSLDAVHKIDNEGLQNLALDLISALQILPASRLLRSSSGSKNLFSDLSRLHLAVSSDDFDIERVIPLLNAVLSNESDDVIWNRVYAAAAEHVPPSISNKAALDTPLKSTSSSQQGSEQIHGEIDQRILQEINGCVYQNTRGFYEKYFEGRSWSPTVEKIVRAAKPQIVDGRWTEYPSPPSQKAFLDWFWTFQARFLKGTRGIYDTSHSAPLDGSDWKRQPDLFLAPSGTTKRNRKYNWADVRVIGELKQSEIPKEYKKELLWFCGHAREVFKSQPTRRFLHGFFIRGSMVELWVLDRSGLYSCEKFDIHMNPQRFIRVMAGYTMMSDEELGMNTYIKEDRIGKYIMFKGEDKAKEEKLYLEGRPIAFQRAIVCRGTACYRAKRRDSKRWEFVVKFSWRSDKRRAEGDLLRLAKERNVWGVAQLFGHQDLDRIDDLRQGMKFGESRTFRLPTGNSFSESQSRTSDLLSGLGISKNPLSSSSSGQKRKRQSENIANGQPKRSRSNSRSSRRQTDITSLVTAEEDDTTVGANKYSVEQPNATSLMGLETPKDGSFDNRIFSCLIISPPGRPINEFKSVREFLEACRDFIKAHRSLYYDGKILHRDISENNIIVTDAEGEGDPRGMLIDLDLAKELDSGPSGARHRTGTMEFMAIEVLEGRAHTYRHDLESFFYVFLWVIIRYGQETDKNLPKTSRLRRWYAGTYEDIAEIKGRHMDKKHFRGIMAEFPPKFDGLKELAEELRRTLFPIRNESLFTGTYRDSDKLYRPMIEAFERAIASYGVVDSG